MPFQNFRNFPNQYVQADNLTTKKPVFFCKFGEIIGPLGTASVALQTEYRSGPIRNATKTRPDIMSTPEQVSNQITVVAGRSSIGDARFTLQDSNNQITTLVTNTTMKNRKCEIWGGFEDIPEDNYVPLFVGQVEDFFLTSDGLSYQFVLVDILSQSKQTILAPKTSLAAPMEKIDTELTVKSASNFAAATDLQDGLGRRNYLRVGDEIMSYESISGNTFKGLRRGVIISQNGSVPVVHEIDDEVVNYVLYDGHPLTLVLQILLSTGNGTNWSGSGTNYDVLPASQGCGIPYTLVNVQNIELQRDRLISWMRFSNYFQAEVEAKAFLEKEIFKVINAYPIVNRAGQFDVKVWTVPLPTIDAITLDDSNIIGVPQYQANYRAGSNFFNRVEVDYEYAPIQDYYVRNQIDINADSQAKYRENSPILIESKMVRTYLKGARLASRIAGQILRRFQDPPPLIMLQAFYTVHLLNVGDIVYLNSSLLPNILKGTRGGESVICEVVSMSVSFATGRVMLTLLGIGFSSNKRYAAISPAGWPEYTLANDGQRRYAYFSQLVTPYTKGSMSNGDDGYYFTP